MYPAMEVDLGLGGGAVMLGSDELCRNCGGCKTTMLLFPFCFCFWLSGCGLNSCLMAFQPPEDQSLTIVAH